LLSRVIACLEAAVDDVDAVRLGVCYMFLHEAAESRQVARHTGNAHHRALSCNNKAIGAVISVSSIAAVICS